MMKNILNALDALTVSDPFEFNEHYAQIKFILIVVGISIILALVISECIWAWLRSKHF